MPPIFNPAYKEPKRRDGTRLDKKLRHSAKQKTPCQKGAVRAWEALNVMCHSEFEILLAVELRSLEEIANWNAIWYKDTIYSLNI